VYRHLAVAGATGAVGSIICQLLQEREFPADSIKFLASARSVGKQIQFRGESYPVEELTAEAFQGIDLVIASTPDEVAAELVPWATQHGAVVIDESGHWRMDAEVPLIVPEVNPHAIESHQGIIASPNCSTTQMVLAMKPLHDVARIRRVVVSTYQATSGAGLAGERELEQGSRAALAGEVEQYELFSSPIAFNLIPQIGSPRHEGYTSEEMKMVRETQKIFEDDTIAICPTCIRVPVMNCHSESILVETERKISVEEAVDLFQQTEGITVVDDLAAGREPMPRDCAGKDDVFIGRIRKDLSSTNGLAFWCVSDNLRKGAATNAIQIAELLVTAAKATP
jgi:aspartate-semialdehyde dehydrogenase